MFCVACNKKFAKDTVFNAHLSGKKHKDKQLALDSQITSNTTKQLHRFQYIINKITCELLKEVRFSLFASFYLVIQHPFNKYKQTINNTKDNVMRKYGRTAADIDEAAEEEEETEVIVDDTEV